MPTPEGKVKNWLNNKLKQKFPDGWYYNTHQGPYGKKGTPDVIACIHGLFIAIEVKVEDGKVTDLQSHQLKKIEKAGGLSFVLYGKDENFLNQNLDPINEVIETIEDVIATIRGD